MIIASVCCSAGTMWRTSPTTTSTSPSTWTCCKTSPQPSWRPSQTRRSDKTRQDKIRQDNALFIPGWKLRTTCYTRLYSYFRFNKREPRSSDQISSDQLKSDQISDHSTPHHTRQDQTRPDQTMCYSFPEGNVVQCHSIKQ